MFQVQAARHTLAPAAFWCASHPRQRGATARSSSTTLCITVTGFSRRKKSAMNSPGAKPRVSNLCATWIDLRYSSWCMVHLASRLQRESFSSSVVATTSGSMGRRNGRINSKPIAGLLIDGSPTVRPASTQKLAKPIYQSGEHR